MSNAYSVAFKQKMVAKLIGKHATSAKRLAEESGVSQNTLSLWRREASNIPGMLSEKPPRRVWTWARKVEILSATAELEGEPLLAYLARENVTLAELDDWRAALQDGNSPSLVATKRIKQLERELARKEKALAEAAVLLILKKKLEDYYSEVEGTNTESENDK